MTPLSGSPSQLTVMTPGKVSASASARKSHDARNLPTIACHAVIGMREQELERAEAALFRPQAHADRRHEEEIQPRVPGEERHQRGFAALEEVADGEGEEAGEQQKDHEEDVGDRRREIAAQLALHDRFDVGPGVHLMQPL